ncbi:MULTISPECIES: three-helix bundle dimerization domain-containing protein [unclassified Rathayibacter]
MTTVPDVDHVVREELRELLDRPVRDYLSVLTERAAKQRLRRTSCAS